MKFIVSNGLCLVGVGVDGVNVRRFSTGETRTNSKVNELMVWFIFGDCLTKQLLEARIVKRDAYESSREEDKIH